MSIATHAIRYGWVYLASLTIGTGTIFMVDPVLMNRITLKDRIEVTMAVVERCYATQTGTNADGTPIYAVAPPVEVRTWYDDNGAPVTVTNSIDWRDDRSMKVDLDAKIRALCPYYVDTNSVYDGTTNIVMCTFTGLLTSLDLGDHTNFTSIPAIGTNAAVYGPWAWRNYSVAWQERYKVLESLRCFQITINSNALWWKTAIGNNNYYYDAWDLIESEVAGNLSSSVVVQSESTPKDACFSWERIQVDTNFGNFSPDAIKVVLVSNAVYCKVFSSQFNGKLNWYVALKNIEDGNDLRSWRGCTWPWWYYGWGWINPEYDPNGTPNTLIGLYYKWSDTDIISNTSPSVSLIVKIADDINWCKRPDATTGHGGTPGEDEAYHSARGFQWKDSKLLFSPTLNYCTNKYW